MIRKGTDSQCPSVVFVSHKNTFDYWVCEVVNTGETLLSKNESLIEFNYRTYMQMLYKWKIKNANKSIIRFKEIISEWTD